MLYTTPGSRWECDRNQIRSVLDGIAEWGRKPSGGNRARRNIETIAQTLGHLLCPADPPLGPPFFAVFSPLVVPTSSNAFCVQRMNIVIPEYKPIHFVTSPHHIVAGGGLGAMFESDLIFPWPPPLPPTFRSIAHIGLFASPIPTAPPHPVSRRCGLRLGSLFFLRVFFEIRIFIIARLSCYQFYYKMTNFF